GFIEAVFPEARIIHCRRDPRDVCWSIFTQNFAHAQKHSTSLTALGQYWNCYDQLMRHWSETLSLPMIEVQYEETIADVEAMSRRLCEFIGVEWDAQAVDFHKSDRTVRTPSRWQVRQPIYKSSAGKWKRYEKHLGPLIEALKM
ncbi:MAG: sulfotransferase, partial [Pseudomonadota bacterium]